MMPNSLADIPPDPVIPPLSDELIVAIAAEIRRAHGWDMISSTIATVFNATRKVLEEAKW